MKNIIYCISLILISLAATAQIDSHKDSLISHLKDSLKEVYKNDEFRDLKIEYESDLYEISSTDEGFSGTTYSMCNNVSYQVEMYEELIKKYYGLLTSKANDSLKLILLDNQKRWEAFHLSEVDLYQIIGDIALDEQKIGTWVVIGTTLESRERLRLKVKSLFEYLIDKRREAIDNPEVFALPFYNCPKFYLFQNNKDLDEQARKLKKEMLTDYYTSHEFYSIIEEIDLLTNLAKNINVDSCLNGKTKALETAEKQIRKSIGELYSILEETTKGTDKFDQAKQIWDAYEESEIKVLHALEKERNYPQDIKTEFNRTYRRFLASKYRLDLYYKYIARDFNN